MTIAALLVHRGSPAERQRRPCRRARRAGDDPCRIDAYRSLRRRVLRRSRRRIAIADRVAHGAAPRAARSAADREWGLGIRRNEHEWFVLVPNAQSLIPQSLSPVSRPRFSPALCCGSCRWSWSAAGRPRTGTRCSTRAPRILATSRCCGPATARATLLDALYYAFVAPWAVWPVAAIVIDLRRRRGHPAWRCVSRSASWCSLSRSFRI